MKSLILLLTALWGATLAAQEPGGRTIGWKFAAGDEFYITETSRVDQRIKVANQTTTRKSEQKTIVRVKVDAVMQDVVSLTLTIEDFKATGDVPKESNLAKTLKAASFSLELTKDGQVRSFRGYEEWVKAWANNNSDQAVILKSMISRNQVRDALAGPLLLLPNATIAQGKSWKVTEVQELGPFGTLTFERNLTPAGTENADGRQLLKINVTGTAQYANPRKLLESLPYSYVSGELKATKYTGTVWFDEARGRLAKADFDVIVEGDLTLALDKEQKVFSVRQQRTVSLTVENERPRVLLGS